MKATITTVIPLEEGRDQQDAAEKAASLLDGVRGIDGVTMTVNLDEEVCTAVTTFEGDHLDLVLATGYGMSRAIGLWETINEMRRNGDTL